MLNKKIGLKLSFMKKGMCKVGFPINSLEKYLELIRKEHFGYVVCEFNELEECINKIVTYTGNKVNIERYSNNCLECKGINIYGEDKYLKAINKYIDNKDIIGE